MFVKAAQTVETLGNLKVLPVLVEGLETLFIGQSWDLNWRHHLHCPTEAEYLDMMDKKTGAMFVMMIQLMKASGKEPPFLYRRPALARLLGRWY